MELSKKLVAVVEPEERRNRYVSFTIERILAEDDKTHTRVVNNHTALEKQQIISENKVLPHSKSWKSDGRASGAASRWNTEEKSAKCSCGFSDSNSELSASNTKQLNSGSFCTYSCCSPLISQRNFTYMDLDIGRDFIFHGEPVHYPNDSLFPPDLSEERGIFRLSVSSKYFVA